jgi:hypothetical protein
MLRLGQAMAIDRHASKARIIKNPLQDMRSGVHHRNEHDFQWFFLS